MTDPQDRQEQQRRRSRLTGRVDETLISSMAIPRHNDHFAARLRAVPDMSSAVADALDELGVGGSISEERLRPLLPASVVAGPVVTLRYRPLDGDVSSNRDVGRGRVFGDRDVYGLGAAGDIAVMDCGGNYTAAVMGALSARWASKAGIAGCLVDGPIRDTASILEAGLPVWSSGHHPKAARYRLEVAELNGPVSLGGVPVHPGDYVVADRDGVSVIPFATVPEVVDFCERAHRDEETLLELIDSAADLADLVAKTSGRPTPT